MTRVFVTGSADGLGRAAAQTLIEDGHQVVVHARSTDRLAGVRDLLDRGAVAVVGDLSDLEETRDLAAQVNRLGRVDAVIHNAGVISGPHVLPVNVVAPYLLTALIHRPQRLVYLSSSMHWGGRTNPDRDGVERPPRDRLVFGQQALRHDARHRPRPHLAGHVQWLATSDDPQARTSGSYWHHQRRAEPAPAVHDQQFQDDLLDALARFTATPLAEQEPKESSCSEQ